MTRAFNLLLLAAMVIGAIVTYDMKYDAERAAEEVARLQRQIDDERTEIALLKAELSMLMQPGRIQAVVEEHADYFGLVPFSPEQIGAIDEIPMRPPSTKEEARLTLARLAAGLQTEVGTMEPAQ